MNKRLAFKCRTNLVSCPLCIWSSSRNWLDNSTVNHLYHGTLQTLPNTTVYLTLLGYNIHAWLLGFKVCYMSCFPPQFELMQNWSSLHQASSFCLWANQRPACRFSNCGAIPSLHWNTSSYKIWLGCCNYEQWLMSHESRMSSEHLYVKGFL